MDRFPLSLPAFLPAFLHRESAELGSLRTAGRRAASGVFALVGGVPELGDHRDEASVDHLCLEKRLATSLAALAPLGGNQLNEPASQDLGAVAMRVVSLLERISTRSLLELTLVAVYVAVSTKGSKACDQ